MKLVIFDMDGTMVDSQHEIVAAMKIAFDAIGQPTPERATLLGVVGLSLYQAMAQLCPGAAADQIEQMVHVYKQAFQQGRVHQKDKAPLYDGVAEVIKTLQAEPDYLLGIATGKSMRGVERALDTHGLQSVFTTIQVSDHHPSKPHPSMILSALSETGLDPADAVMIGDTTFDMEMARAAGVAGIGVSWGYHKVEELQVDNVIDHISELPALLQQIWGRP